MNRDSSTFNFNIHEKDYVIRVAIGATATRKEDKRFSLPNERR